MGPSLPALLEERFHFSDALARLDGEGLRRSRLALDSPQGPVVHLEGREFLNFCSNDYLSLARDPEIIQALAEGAARFGAGAGASPLVCGRLSVHEALEEEIAGWLQRDRALLFSSGYLANLAVVSTFSGRGGLVLEDRLNHASLIDGAVLSRARLRRYAHRDAAAAVAILRQAAATKLVLTDGVFSMDGDRAPVAELAAACREAGALFAVDDAHGIGVFGRAGGGVLEEAGLQQDDVPLLMGTFGKALGAGGAFVAGPAPIIETMVQRARPYIYSTGLAPALAAATLAAIRRVRRDADLRSRLGQRVAFYREQAAARGLPAGEPGSPIQPFITGSAQGAVDASAALRTRGILVTPIRPPTVPRGSARLRITITAGHEEGHILQLVEALAACRAGR